MIGHQRTLSDGRTPKPFSIARKILQPIDKGKSRHNTAVKPSPAYLSVLRFGHSFALPF
jgi:hypothetical protein